jgi:hypothetical protein
VTRARSQVARNTTKRTTKGAITYLFRVEKIYILIKSLVH